MLQKFKKLTLSIFVVLLLNVSTYIGSAEAESSPLANPTAPNSPEIPRSMTMKEYQADVREFYAQIPNHKVVMDMANPEGIDPSLLPPDVAALVDHNTKIVAFKETVIEVSEGKSLGKAHGLAKLCQTTSMNIWCAWYNGTRDLTVSTIYGGVRQYSRVIALRYDNYPGCSQPCIGWEIERQYSWWVRSTFSWSVTDAQLKTNITGEDYCSQGDATLDHSSAWFTPTWLGNSSLVYSISGFPNNAYVPFFRGWSRTQSDIWENTTRRYNDARTYQYWPRD